MADGGGSRASSDGATSERAGAEERLPRELAAGGMRPGHGDRSEERAQRGAAASFVTRAAPPASGCVRAHFA